MLSQKRRKFCFSLEVTSETKYRECFQQIQKIGSLKPAEYKAEIKFNSAEEPWKDKTKLRAIRIRREINRCFKDGGNEQDLRIAVEKEVFLRFRVEVICRQCRRKIWQAEWKKAFQSAEVGRGESIKPFMRDNDCKCKPKHRDDRDAEGLSKMFGCSAEPRIHYEDKEIVEAYRTHQEPDSIYSLYRAGRIESLLNASSISPGKKVEEIVKSRISETGQNMAFPFLLFEAKSGVATTNFENIQLQSCHPIREMLLIQHDLFFDQETKVHREARPLVWFIACQGHLWIVSGAYYHKDTTQIVLLWSGNIADTEKALQLLLIVDYICHWARSVYRTNVIERLLLLTDDPSGSLAAPSATNSVSDNRTWTQKADDFVHRQNQYQELEENYSLLPKREIDVPQVLELLDSEHMAIRDANYRRFRVCALQINMDNIEDFFLGERNHEAASKRAKELLRCFKGCDAWRVKIGALKALERSWVECPIDRTEPGDREESYLTRFGIHSYIECRPRTQNGWRPGNWLQIHELSFIAVSEAAIADLEKRADYKRDRSKIDVQYCPKASENSLLRYFERLKGAPVRDYLAAAMAQRSVISGSVEPRLSEDPEAGDLDGGKVGLVMEMYKCLDKDESFVIDVPRAIYNRYKIGRKEPSETFIWKQPRQSEPSGQKHPPIQQPVENGILRSYVLEEDGAVVVTNGPRSCCVFLVEPKARGMISISQAYSIATLVAGEMFKCLSATEPDEEDLSSFKKNMLSFLRGIIDLVDASSGRRRSLTAQLTSSSIFVEKIATYVDADTDTADESIKEELVTSFEKAAREYGLKKILRGLLLSFENMPDNAESSSSADEDESTDDEDEENEDDDDDETEDGDNNDDDEDNEDNDDDEDEENNNSSSEPESSSESGDSESSTNGVQDRAREDRSRSLSYRFKQK